MKKQTTPSKKHGSLDIDCTQFKWLDDESAKCAAKMRDDLLKSLSGKARYSFCKTKIHTGDLSQGCKICGAGYWSCLLINSRCTSSCFFCPSQKTIDEDRPPHTIDGTSFKSVDDYISFLVKFSFRGVGISGGEPLLMYDQVLEYVKGIRSAFNEGMYVWLYSNGDLVTKQKMIALRDAGLDEIRFNICATDYDLKPVRIASKIMKTVTIEIPSIPEDCERLKCLLLDMQNANVKHLNLHQLYATPANQKGLANRGYTLVHESPPSVFESEICALEVMKYAAESGIGPPINYCSVDYQGKFHSRSRRLLLNGFVKRNHEEITDAYYIRELTLLGSEQVITDICAILEAKYCDHGLWSYHGAKNAICLHSTLLKGVDIKACDLLITYSHAAFTSSLSLGYDSDNSSGDDVSRITDINMTLHHKALIDSYIEFFISNNQTYDLRNSLANVHGLESNQIREALRIMATLQSFEHIEESFPEIV